MKRKLKVEIIIKKMNMGIFSSRKVIKCPLCEQEIDIKKAKEEELIEILGKDEQGYIHIKHKGFCGAHIVWDTLWNKVWEKDI